MNTNKLMYRAQVTLFLILAVFVMSATGWATAYYVDATNGTDYNDGLSPSTAWKTIAKVNASSFDPGEQILFKRGEVWREQLIVPSSGSSGSPITFGAYGSGNKPIINGADVISGWTLDSGYIYYATVTWSPNNNWCIEDATILTQKGSKGAMTQASFYFDDANDKLYVWCTDDANPSTHTMEFGRRNYAIEQRKDYITVDGLTLKHVARYGFLLASTPDNCVVKNCIFEYNSGTGMLHCNGDNALIQNNIFRYNNTHGLYVSDGGQNGIVEENIMHNNGVQGFQMNGDGITMTGWHIRYNTSYNNGARGLLLMDGSGNYIYHNIIYNNNKKTQHAEIALDDGGHGGGHGFSSSYFYNNTIFSTSRTFGDVISAMDYSPNNTWKNNILYAGNCPLWEIESTSNSGNAFDYNLNYRETGATIADLPDGPKNWSAWQAAGNDVNGINSNPKFTNTTNNDFRLQYNSPCIDAGVDVGLPFVGEAPDMGAFEFNFGDDTPPTPPTGLLISQ